MRNSVFRLSLVAVLTATLTWGSFSCTPKTIPIPLKELIISEDITLSAFNADGLNLLFSELDISLPQGKWPSSSLLSTHGVYCSDLFYLDTGESIHVVISSDSHLYGHPLLGCAISDDISGILVNVTRILMIQGQVGLSSWISGYTNCHYREVGTTFETSFDFSTPPGAFISRNNDLIAMYSPLIIITLIGLIVWPVVPIQAIPAVILIISVNIGASISDIVQSIWLIRFDKNSVVGFDGKGSIVCEP